MISRGPRDTRTWYLDADPGDQVDLALVDFAAARAGRTVLDLGCGLGGYTRALGERGFDAIGLDVEEAYVHAHASTACERRRTTVPASRWRTAPWTPWWRSR